MSDDLLRELDKAEHSEDCYYEEGVLCHCEIKAALRVLNELRGEL